MADVSLEALTQYGHLTLAASYHDEYPSLSDGAGDRSLGLVVDQLLEGLPEPQRRCIELVVLSRLSYRDAAEFMGWHTAGSKPDGKKAWRAVRTGLERLRRRLDGDGWPQAIAGHRLPGGGA